MKNSKHICFDLETLGHNPTAPIIQIAAVKFDLNGIEEDIPFKATIDLDTIKFKDFGMDGETIKWWFIQSQDAIRNVILAGDVSLSHALHLFREWI